LTTGAYAVVLVVSRPFGLESGAVMLRYMIILVPTALACVALGLDTLLNRAPQVSWMRPGLPLAATAGLIGCLWAAGPLPALYGSPNNFANHSAFQFSYEHPTWEHAEAHAVYPAPPLAQDQIPSFYRWLGQQSNAAAIIEYPFDICDYNDCFYYYQHFHHKQVLAGYCLDARLAGYRFPPRPAQSAAPIHIGRWCADTILSAVADPSMLAFRNMIDVLDGTALSHSGADFLVLHKYVQALRFMTSADNSTPLYDSMPLYYRSVDVLGVQFKEVLGPPIYEDAEIICFQFRRSQPSPSP
jgi:hypothetical protein